MILPSLDEQRLYLSEIQHGHAVRLMGSGIASLAFSRRFDDEWFSDAAISSATAESIPVTMLDASDPSRSYLYLFLRRRGEDDIVLGEEVNIGIVTNPGTPQEAVIPEPGFTVDQVTVVHALASELAARRDADLPNLSSDLLTIVE